MAKREGDCKIDAESTGVIRHKAQGCKGYVDRGGQGDVGRSGGLSFTCSYVHTYMLR